MRREHLAMLIGLRTEIDSIDKQLLTLLAQRFECVEQLAPLKNAEKLFDDVRHQQVLASREAWANDMKLDPQFTRDVFELIMKHSVVVQKAYWDKKS